MYERRRDQILPLGAFVWRLIRHVGVAVVVVVASLFVGIAGYVRFERLSWLDGFLNAAMLLGGMGPVEPPQTPGGKVFVGLYALYAGMVFLVVAGIILAPVVHRVLHKFHWDEEPPAHDDLAAAGGRSRRRRPSE